LNLSTWTSSLEGRLPDPSHFLNRDRLFEHLLSLWLPLNRPHHVHPRNHAAESGEALSIRVPPAAIVKLRLIPDANEEFRVSSADYVLSKL
jgi:hypothetical protein